MEGNRVQVASKLLTDVAGRDKIMRTCGFTAGLLATFAGNNTAQKFRTIQGQISSCRVVLRLFGDLPMWMGAKRSRFGKTSVVKEETKPGTNPFAETISTVNVAADLLYLPVEHIAWAAQNGLVPVSAGRWWSGAIAVWALSLVMAIYRSLSNLKALAENIKRLRHKKDETTREQYWTLRRQLDNERLNVLRCSADLVCAVNNLPRGILWSQRLSPRWHCLFGVVSSITGLLQVKRGLFPTTTQGQ